MESYLYVFSGINELVCACKFISSLPSQSLTSVYYEDTCGKTKYYLLFSQSVYDIRSELYPMCAISEFSECEIKPSRAVRAYLKERCYLLAEENASEIFAEFC